MPRLFAAEPDWPVVEKHALEVLQRHVRIATVNPPANTGDAGALFQAELEAVGQTKGIGVQQLTALVTIKRMGIVPAHDIVMISTADEEPGGVRGIQWMLKNHWDEIDPEYLLDEGGWEAVTCSLPES